MLQVSKAIKQHDFATFQKYVDIDSVTTRLIDDMMVLGIIESKDEDPTGTAIGAGLLQLMKPRLVDEAKKQLARFVEVGNFTDTNRVVSPFQELNTSASYRGVVSQRRDGKIAVLGLAFTNRSEGYSRTVEIKLRDVGSYWQVAELSNISELVQKQKIEAQERLSRNNAPIIAKINKLLKITAFGKSPGSDQYGISKQVVFRLTVQNIGNVPVRGYSAVICQKDTLGKTVKALRIRSDDVISPGASDSGSWEFDINEFSASDVALYKASLAAADVQFVRVKPDPGPELVVEE